MREGLQTLLKTTQKVEGKKMVLSGKKYPAFIKPYYPPNGRKSLSLKYGVTLEKGEIKLPPPFTSFIKEMLPTKRALLKDHYHGNFWAVEVEKIGSDFYFQAGWTRFLEDNCLEFGDFLVFQYNGDDEFRFKILRSTSVSRDTNILGAMDFSSNEFVQEVVHEGTPIDNKNISEGDREEVVMVEVEEEGETEEYEEEIFDKNLGKRKVRSSGASTAKIGETSTYFSGMANPAVEGQNHKKKRENEDLRSKVSALQNPYFLANFLKSLKNQVYVPKDFVNALHARLLPPDMVIRDQHGRASLTRFNLRKDSSTWMVGGWRHLALQNNVGYDDCLAFELVPMGDDKKGYYIQLHIFRVAQEFQNS